MTPSPVDSFDFLADRSRSLHGHRYVLPVAGWALQSQSRAIGVTEAMRGLGGQADRTRVIEALVKLAEFGAVIELPRANERTAPRFFERVDSPYWNLVRAYLVELEEADSSGSADPWGIEGSQIP